MRLSSTRTAARTGRLRPRGRRGMMLVEILVVIAILLGVAAILIPTVSSYMQLEQRRVAKELALSYELLHDQAVMRNTTFRIAYHLDANAYQVEVGDPDVLIFDNPEDRIEYEEDLEDLLDAFDEDDPDRPEDPTSSFQKLQDRFGARVELPRGTRFGGVYTPQYEDMMEPSGVDPEVDPEEAVVVYSYIFSTGFTEHTVVWLVDEDDPESGYTVEIEPLSGRVHLVGELRSWEDRFDFVPTAGPELEL